MANFQVMMKEAQEKFNLLKWNRYQKKEELDAIDTEMAHIRGEFRLMERLMQEEKKKVEAEREAKEKASLDRDIEGTP